MPKGDGSAAYSRADFEANIWDTAENIRNPGDYSIRGDKVAFMPRAAASTNSGGAPLRRTACHREELQQPVFMAIDTLEYPELHDESIPTLAFIKSLNRLLVAAGIKDFNMQVCCKFWAISIMQNPHDVLISCLNLTARWVCSKICTSQIQTGSGAILVASSILQNFERKS